MSNQTREDAFARVVQGKLGSLAESPSETYLVALREFLYAWIGEVDARLHELRSKPEDEVPEECEYWQELRFQAADRSFDGGEFSAAHQRAPRCQPCGECESCR